MYICSLLITITTLPRKGFYGIFACRVVTQHLTSLCPGLVLCKENKSVTCIWFGSLLEESISSGHQVGLCNLTPLPGMTDTPEYPWDCLCKTGSGGIAPRNDHKRLFVSRVDFTRLFRQQIAMYRWGRNTSFTARTELHLCCLAVYGDELLSSWVE